ncbi:helix-turn-helix transcriptional regulator [Phycisphaerales bacterium AB-hyl4]|uniref:Helix-turn-helix transcriptional regulator n=1 Tax=Natronomicrosphaera hydrolytica TaxID=3242702 RepID=A0ABV4U551_9BACT
MDNIDFHPQHADRPQPPATTLAYRVRTLGRMRDDPFHSTRGTFHDDAMLTIVLAGRGVYLHGRSRQTIAAGMVGLVLPHVEPGILMADADRPYDHVYCRFAGGEALTTARRIRDEQGGGQAFFRHPRWSEAAEPLLATLHARHIRHDPANEQPERPTVLEAALMSALTTLDHRSAEPTSLPPLTAESLRGYLRDHMAEPAHLAPVAEHFAMSKAHLCRVGRQLLGRTVHAEWQAIKLQWSAVLLNEPSLSIADVARRVGYNDPLYFSRVFRRSLGQSPRAYRQQTIGDREA